MLLYTIVFIFVYSFLLNFINMQKLSRKLLRHIVLFSFTAMSSEMDVKNVENYFSRMKSDIPEILSLESGINNSPEALSKGFTHCFLLGFETESDRDVYLCHPEHERFKKWVADYIDDVLVFDFWS
jgi:hypothetical protein